MSALPRFLTLLAPFCLAGCPIPEVAHCADYDLCTTSSGSNAASTGGDPLPTGEVQTVTSDGEVTTTTTTTAAPSTTGDPVVPAVVSVMFTPDPLEQVGIIDIDVVAEHADHVRMNRPGFEPIELTKGPDEHFHGAIEILSGLANGTHEASFLPRQEQVEGSIEISYYTVALPEAGSEILWDVVPDDGLGQVDALAVLGDDAIVGLGTLYDGDTPRCYAHRRNLDGSYSGADVQVLFPEYPCTAVDIETDGETIDLLVTITGGDGPRWRMATMAWDQTVTVLRTGEKDEVAHALARDANGKRVVCGTGPSSAPLMDKIDGRVWMFNGPTIELDYAPTLDLHRFDETVMDCAFRAGQLVLVGEVYGKHEGDPNNLQPPRKRPFLVELDGQGQPPWIVPGLGPGNTTQGGASTLAIDDQGRAVVGLYTCGDACDPEPELWLYEPGGKVVWQVTLPAEVSVPFGLTWSPAGYAVIAGAHGTGNTTQFLLQGYLPHTYGPAWTFLKGKQAGLHVAFAVVAAPGAVVGAGLGAGGYPAFAFVKP